MSAVIVCLSVYRPMCSVYSHW